MIILFLMSLTLSLALIDIAIKSYVEGYMKKGEERTACKGRILIRKVYNKGMCLNLFEDHQDFVKVSSAIVTMLLTIYQCITLVRKRHYLKKAGLSLMTAGAWSNTFDRWIRGYVIDYVGFKIRWEKITRITYNLGDFFLAAGAVLMMLSSVFHFKKRKN